MLNRVLVLCFLLFQYFQWVLSQFHRKADGNVHCAPWKKKYHLKEMPTGLDLAKRIRFTGFVKDFVCMTIQLYWRRWKIRRVTVVFTYLTHGLQALRKWASTNGGILSVFVFFLCVSACSFLCEKNILVRFAFLTFILDTRMHWAPIRLQSKWAPINYYISHYISSLRAKNVDFHTAKNIQIRATLFRSF